MAERDSQGRFVKGSAGFTGNHTREAREKMSESKKGKRPWIKGKTKEDYPQLSNAGRKEGHIPWNKGLTMEDDERIVSPKGRDIWWRDKIGASLKGRKLSEEHKEKCKENWFKEEEEHPFWNGGSSFYPYPVGWRESLKESIRERDEYTCQLCGDHEDELDRKLHVHHIDYEKENLDPNNLISLCNSCHAKTNFNRDEWYNYFS